jgi:hypothetical protein
MHEWRCHDWRGVHKIREIRFSALIRGLLSRTSFLNCCRWAVSEVIHRYGRGFVVAAPVVLVVGGAVHLWLTVEHH